MPEVKTSRFFKYDENQKVLYCLENWTVDRLAKLSRRIERLRHKKKQITQIDGSKIKKLDSAGALFLQDLMVSYKKNNTPLILTGFNSQQQSLLDLVAKEAGNIKKELPEPERPNPFYKLGRATVNHLSQLTDFLRFIGELFVTLYRTFQHPLKFQWRSIIAAIENNGYQALPIIALMNFLIGIVLTYQVADQLRQYGADIYIVDITGIGILREFAPLITAIILAGRTSTSFAALLGTMKVNQEIDALLTMGLSPMARLVLPRVIGLMIALPLLVVWADMFGILGSVIMTKSMLSINYHAYFQRFEQSIGAKHYLLGLIKTPFFALIIAGVGCFQGFQTGGSAESVGVQTTKAAVQAIFLVIVVDALFSILFSKMGY